MEPVSAFPVPMRMPNGLQWYGDDLLVIDQYTDDVYVMDEMGRVIRTFSTLTENGSGIAIGGGYLWTASNGKTPARPFRSTDTHEPGVLKLDIETGELVQRFPTPDGGGVHGIEWDEGRLWLTQFNPKAIVLVDAEDFHVIRSFPSDLGSPHGLARDGDGIWCSDRSEHVVVKYHVTTGEELDRIIFPEPGPEPHGLSIKDGVLWYADAAYSGETPPGKQEIGRIVR